VSSFPGNGDGLAAALDEDGAGAHAVRLGNVSVDLATYKASVAADPVNLTYQEFELLRYLADARDRVVSFDVLSGLLWGSTGPRQHRRLNVLVCRLRNKLRNSFPYRLETVRGRGYGLLGAGKGDQAQAGGGGGA
jgi:two-component system response regulator VicR